MQQAIHNIRNHIRRNQPLIHCITNPISINACANAILAVGGRPIMAEHPMEAAEITRTARALMVNTGNITDARMESMKISARTAQENGIPMVLDAVGISCSTLRREYIQGLLDTVRPTVIKGNYSEIQGLYHDAYRCSGVDADASLDLRAVDLAAAVLARRRGAIVLASGKTDVVTDGQRLVHIHNGTPQLSRITGTGCMLGALCAAYLSAGAGLKAVVAACAVLGICGQLSETSRGTGTFMCDLMDALSTLTECDLEKYLNLEEIPIEIL